MKCLLFALLIVLVVVCCAKADETSLLPQPPLDVWGVKYCGGSVLWVITAEGNVRRFDNEHRAPLPPEVFQAWIDSAPAEHVDIVELACPMST